MSISRSGTACYIFLSLEYLYKWLLLVNLFINIILILGFLCWLIQVNNICKDATVEYESKFIIIWMSLAASGPPFPSKSASRSGSIPHPEISTLKSTGSVELS